MSTSGLNAPQRGFALVIVLWAVAMLSLIAVSVISSGSLSLHMERNAVLETRGAFILEGAINRVILGLADARPEKRFRFDGAEQELTLGENVVHIWIQNTSGLIDLNEADPNLLARLFTSAGIVQDEANRLAKRVVEWRSVRPASVETESDGQYSASGRSYRPRHGAFQSLDELNLVLGMTPALFEQISPALTIYSHRPGFDPSLAPKHVLLTASGTNEEEADQMLAARQSGTETAGNGATYRIQGRVTVENRALERTVVVRLNGDVRNPVSILYWN